MLLVVIVNYKTPGLTADCLKSLQSEINDTSVGPIHVVVADNNSPDDSLQHLRKTIDKQGFGHWCSLLPLPSNGGFAYGNNAPIRTALASAQPPEFVLLLNPDTVVRPGAIRELVRYMREHSDVGIAGSRLEDPDSTPVSPAQVSAFRFHTAVNEFSSALRLGPISKLLSRHEVGLIPGDAVAACDWVAGASMIIRKSVFDKIGLLDEGYFMYFEEVDFCLRAARAGFACRYVPASRVVHLVGQASGVTDKSKANKRRPAYWFQSRRRYFVKNFGRGYAILADLAFIIGFVPWRVRRIIQRKPDTDPAHMLFDSVKHSALFKSAGGEGVGGERKTT